MKRIDEKIAISGDGAELIQSYLNELNMKLLAVGITESYSIVMEAETLFISEINELNKTSKVTIYEVQKIIEKHGTPDEIVSRYLKASEAERDEEFYSMDPKTKELIKRSSSIGADFTKAKEIILKSFGIASLIVPPYLMFLSLLQLNNYTRENILISSLLNLFSISNSNVKPFLAISILLIIVNEALTSYTGNLFFSLQNTIRIRTLNRSILLSGAYVSNYLGYLYKSDPWFDRDVIKYDQSTFQMWIYGFIIVEIVILGRDHISSFYPLQPKFIPLERFVKLPYILFITSVILTNRTLSEHNTILVNMCLGTLFLATITSGLQKYRTSLRFYMILSIIPMLLTLGYSFVRPFIFIEIVTSVLIIWRKNWSESSKIVKKLISLIK